VTSQMINTTYTDTMNFTSLSWKHQPQIFVETVSITGLFGGIIAGSGNVQTGWFPVWRALGTRRAQRSSPCVSPEVQTEQRGSNRSAPLGFSRPISHT